MIFLMVSDLLADIHYKAVHYKVVKCEYYWTFLAKVKEQMSDILCNSFECP